MSVHATPEWCIYYDKPGKNRKYHSKKLIIGGNLSGDVGNKFKIYGDGRKCAEHRLLLELTEFII